MFSNQLMSPELDLRQNAIRSISNEPITAPLSKQAHFNLENHHLSTMQNSTLVFPLYHLPQKTLD